MSTNRRPLLALVALGSAVGCGAGSNPGGPNPPSVRMVIIEGSGQVGLGGQPLPLEAIIRVEDQSGNPKSGVTVTWVVSRGNGTVSSSAATGANGRARTVWTLGTDSVRHTLEARIDGASPAIFTANGVPPATAIAYEAWTTANRTPTDIFLMDPEATVVVRVTDDPGDDGAPAWSPDRTRIAFKSNRGAPAGSLEYDVYVVPITGGTARRLTNARERDIDPEWSPDGTRIVFTSYRNRTLALPQQADIYVMNADGSNQVRLTSDDREDGTPDWSPDGTRIVFATQRYGDREIAVMNPDGTGLVRLTTNPADDDEPTWSPDGTRIAFSTDRFSPGRYEVVVMNADGSGVTRLAAHPGSQNDYGAAWSPDGTKIAYTCWRMRGAEVFSEVCSMNADGSGEVRLTLGVPWASWASWQR